MADDDTTGQDADTIPMAEHKNLQRKFDRLSKKLAKTTERAETSESGQDRLESLMVGIAEALTDGDDTSTARVKELVAQNTTQKSADATAAQLTARLDQAVDDAGEDWEDGKFDAARAVLAEIQTSGDLTRGHEVERLIRDATSTEDESVEDKIKAAVLADRQSTGRVDTNESSATSGKVRFGDITSMNPKAEGIGSMREKMKKALDQFYGEG